MTVEFREARSKDVPAIIAMLVDDVLGSGREDADPEPYQVAFARMQKEGGNTVIVGELDGRLVATYQITFISGLSLRAARRAQIESVRVASDMRGKKIGEAMIADAEARARASECRLMQLTMNQSRTDTSRFYQRLGFTPSHIGFKRDLS